MPAVRENVPLAPLTTLRLGGAARRLVEIDREEDLAQALSGGRNEPVLVLGGGSNLVVADEGFAGLVVRLAMRGIERRGAGDRVLLDVAAGEDWDALVARAADEGLAGIEAMSGIPGLVGATPIQNVGAYGQEVRETIVSVRVFDREDASFREIAAEDCGFSYRWSRFKEAPERYVVTRVRFALSPSAESAPVRYAELARALGVAEGARAPLRTVRETVIALRRTKGMVLDAADPESVSAGSFFVNPVVSDQEADRVEERARAAGIDAKMPRFAADSGRTKLSAGWLVERAGFARGYGAGRVGVSRKHALALVHRGGGTTRELLALAREIVAGVRARFGVTLTPEPVIVGTSL